MQSVPYSVIERIAVFADDKLLTLLATCCRRLWEYTSMQQRIWSQRYCRLYNFQDDNELQWLTWYVRTLRASGSLNGTANDAKLDIARLDRHGMNWFHAFCHRRSSDANWRKQVAYPSQHVTKEPIDSRCSIVLQRIIHQNSTLGDCAIIEQRQLVGRSNTPRFWHLRKLYCDKPGPRTIIQQFLTSDRFAVAIGESFVNPNDPHIEMNTIYIWPIHKVSVTRPRQITLPFNMNAEMRGRWLVAHYTRKVYYTEEGYMLSTSTHAIDLATHRVYPGFIDDVETSRFIQRATDSTVDVFTAKSTREDLSYAIEWCVWRFSTTDIGGNPQCLLQGTFSMAYSYILPSPVRRLDDDRVFIQNNHAYSPNIQSQTRDDVLTVGVLSTAVDSPHEFISDRELTWWHHTPLYMTRVHLSSNRIIVGSGQGWITYNLTDGTIVSSTSMETLYQALSEHLSHDHIQSLLARPCLFSSFVFRAVTDESTVLVDILDPKRCYQLKIVTAPKHSLLNTDRITRNAILLVDTTSNSYSVIDLSC